jgi:hypothetical protein
LNLSRETAANNANKHGTQMSAQTIAAYRYHINSTAALGGAKRPLSTQTCRVFNKNSLARHRVPLPTIERNEDSVAGNLRDIPTTRLLTEWLGKGHAKLLQGILLSFYPPPQMIGVSIVGIPPVRRTPLRCILRLVQRPQD